jgi:hypothetical protein
MTLRSRLGRVLVELRRRRLERHLTRHLPRSPGGVAAVVVEGDAGATLAHRLTLQKERRRFVLAFDYRSALQSDWLLHTYRTRPRVLLDALCRTTRDLSLVRAEISDGADSADGMAGFCSARPGSVLVPDPDFYVSQGYADSRGPSPAWSTRDSNIVWRGASTGRGVIAGDGMTPGDDRLIQRTRLCLLLRQVAGTDVKLVNAIQSPDPRRDLQRLRAAGILGERISKEFWRERKFALDIDGNGNAWSNLFTRLLYGCCVIKIGSPAGYRQWYYDALRPFEHFVPVAPDLSDLVERIAWCRGHDAECAAIAAAGQAVARGRTFDREMAMAGEALAQHYSR